MPAKWSQSSEVFLFPNVASGCFRNWVKLLMQGFDIDTIKMWHKWAYSCTCSEYCWVSALPDNLCDPGMILTCRWMQFTTWWGRKPALLWTPRARLLEALFYTICTLDLFWTGLRCRTHWIEECFNSVFEPRFCSERLLFPLKRKIIGSKQHLMLGRHLALVQ